MSEQNVLDGLRAKRTALGSKKTVTIDVPGYEGDLCVRYQWKPYEDLAKRGEALAKVKNPTQRDLLGAADTLIELCDEILIRVDGEVKPLGTDGEPLTFTLVDELGEALGFQASTARAAVFRTFENEYAVLSMAVRLSAWLEDTTREVDGEFAGN